LDGRKFNKGTKGNKGGRKPKADEIKLIEQMDAIAVPELAWRALWNKCKEGDTQAIKTWLAYRYGQPKQSIDHTTQGKQIGLSDAEIDAKIQTALSIINE
jgi:hypothetical protein